MVLSKHGKSDLALFHFNQRNFSKTIQFWKWTTNVNLLSISSPRLILFLWNIRLAFNLLD